MSPFKILFTISFLSLALGPFRTAFGQEEDIRFKALDVRGHVTSYRDETDETTRLHKDQTDDDGDQVTTEDKSEVVFRLRGKAYVHLAPNTRVLISRLRAAEPKGIECRLTLVYGRLIVQLDKTPTTPFEVIAGTVHSRVHGTLLEVIRNKTKDTVRVLCHEGNVVTNSKGHVEMAKKGQVVEFAKGGFKSKYYFSMEDEADMEEWQQYLHEVRTHRTNQPH